MRFVLLSTLLCLLLGPAAAVLAHGDGASFEEVVGPYVVDVGYEPEELRAKGTLLLDFSLLDAKSKSAVEYSSVWVRIEQAGEAHLATGVEKVPAAATTLLYKVGETPIPLIISVRFERGGETLAQSSFTLPVHPSPTAPQAGEAPWVLLCLFAVIGIVGGAMGAALYLKSS